MNYPRRVIQDHEIKDGLRVYVADLDVFGRVAKNGKVVICEPPMPNYEFDIGSRYRPLYDQAIGERDPE